MKLWTVRRDETITFIRTAAVPNHANRRELVADLLLSRYPIDQPTSVGMAQGRYRHPWAAAALALIRQRRHYRRACIAIRSAILGQAVGAAAPLVNALADVALPGALAADLNAAFLHEDDDLQQALLELTTTPLVFMANRPLRVGDVFVSGSANRVFYYDHMATEYKFEPPAALTLGEMLVYGGPGVGNVRVAFRQRPVYHVRVQPFIALPLVGAIPGDDIPAADNIVITRQLTGCSFMYQTNGIRMTAIHVLPGGLIGGPGRHLALAPTLRNRVAGFHVGAVGAPGVMTVFGCQNPVVNADDYWPAGHSVNVVGVRTPAGVWHVYTQGRSLAPPGPIVNHGQVT